MHLARRLGMTLEETERLTAWELSAWLQLDRPPTQQPPRRIEDFLAKVRSKPCRR